MFAPIRVPVSLTLGKVQLRFMSGASNIVTAHPKPSSIAVNVYGPSAVIVKASTPLFCITRVSVPMPAPVIVPPIVYWVVIQLTSALVTSAAMVPEAFAGIVHVWFGPVGCVATLAAYVAPSSTGVVNVYAVLQ